MMKKRKLKLSFLSGLVILVATAYSLALFSYTTDETEFLKTYNGERFVEACYKGDINVVRRALELGIDPDLTDRFGDHGLLYASRGGHIEIVRLLVAYGADVNKETKSHAKALSRAASSQKPEIIRFLLENGAEIEKKRGQNSAVFSAVAGEDRVAIDNAIKSYKNSTKLTFKDYQDFHNLEIFNEIKKKLHDKKLQSLILILKAGENPDLGRAETGETALGVAIQLGYEDISKLLLCYHADPTIKNKKGEDALSLAINNSQENIINWIKNPESLECEGY